MHTLLRIIECLPTPISRQQAYFEYPRLAGNGSIWAGDFDSAPQTPPLPFRMLECRHRQLGGHLVDVIDLVVAVLGCLQAGPDVEELSHGIGCSCKVLSGDLDFRVLAFDFRDKYL